MNWLPEHGEAFFKIKKILANEALFNFPDYLHIFYINANENGFQMGALIYQKNGIVFYQWKKLNPAQQRYPMTHREIFSIKEALKACRQMLLSQKLVVYTNHKNLVHLDLKKSCVLGWRLKIKELAHDIW